MSSLSRPLKYCVVTYPLQSHEVTGTLRAENLGIVLHYLLYQFFDFDFEADNKLVNNQGCIFLHEDLSEDGSLSDDDPSEEDDADGRFLGNDAIHLSSPFEGENIRHSKRKQNN
jgi:hypothetical protein